MMNATLESTAISEARRVASLYARRANFWWFDEGDLVGEAIVAALRAVRTKDPLRGGDRAYFGRAAAHACVEFIKRMGSPVGCPKNKKGDRKQTVRVPVNDEDTVDDRPSPEAAIWEQEWKEKWNRKFFEATGCYKKLRKDVCLVILGASVTKVAAELGVPRRNLYFHVDKAKKELRKNQHLSELRDEFFM